MDNLLNVNQIAFILKVHPLTIRRYIREGKLKAVKVAGNVRVKEADLTAFQKEFTTDENFPSSPFKKNIQVNRPFTTADPFLRLNGRAASIEL